MAKLEDTLKERGNRYGDFTDHAKIAQRTLDGWEMTEGWSKLSDDKKQAMRMFADKTARILNGDPEYKDNWHDIGGYAKLAEDRCIVKCGSPKLKKCACGDDSPHPWTERCRACK